MKIFRQFFEKFESLCMNENELVFAESGGEATIVAFTENEDFYIYEVDFIDTAKVQGSAIFHLPLQNAKL